MSEFREGVFFNMSEDEYFSVPALSASGMKNLRMSPLDFWARAAWLNPHIEDESDELSEARAIGKAFHKRIVEGKDAFARGYAPFLNPSTFTGLLRTNDDLKDAIRKHNENADTKIPLGGKKEDLVARLLEVDPTVKIWDVELEKYGSDHAGQHLLSQDWLEKIELAAAMVERHPHLSKAFMGGAPEISIFWTCPKIGVNCKARLDYLKPRAIVDLKTMANTLGKPLNEAVAREFASRRYFIQGAFYEEAAAQVARLIKEGLSDRESPGYDASGLLNGLAAGHAKTVLFVFQVKGVAPVAMGRTFSAQSLTFQVAQAEIENLKQTYRTYSEKFGSDPWVDASVIEQFTDEEIPGWALQ